MVSWFVYSLVALALILYHCRRLSRGSDHVSLGFGGRILSVYRKLQY